MDKNNDSVEYLNSLLVQYKNAKQEKVKTQTKDLIVLNCLHIVKAIAYSIAKRSTDPVEDIIQVGCIGLVKAIDLYKPIVGKNFKSYAKVFITGEIKHYLRDNTGLIKSSRAMRELSYKINKLVTELTEKLGHAPSNEEIAEALQVPTEKVTECFTQDRRTTVISIDDNNDSSDDNVYSLVERIEDESTKRTILSYENRMLLDEIVSELDPLSQDLVNSYFYDELTHSELALRYNISQLNVTKKLKLAIETITKKLFEQGLKNLDEE